MVRATGLEPEQGCHPAAIARSTGDFSKSIQPNPLCPSQGRAKHFRVRAKNWQFLLLPAEEGVLFSIGHNSAEIEGFGKIPDRIGERGWPGVLEI